jgi:site-specific recombinase XerD
MTSKSLKYIIGLIILLIIAGGAYWYFFVRGIGTTDFGEPSNTQQNGFTPFGRTPTQSSGTSTSTPRVGTNGTGSTASGTQLKIPTLRLLSNTPVAGYGASTTGPVNAKAASTTTAIRWIDRGRGNVYEARGNTLDIKTISNTVVPKMYESVWNKNLSSFLAFGITEKNNVGGIWAELRARVMPKVSPTQPALPTSAELTTLLRSVASSRAPLIIKKRDQALISLMLETGLKLAIIANLKIEQVKKNKIRYEDHQGRHELSLSPTVITNLKDYLTLRPDPSARGGSAFGGNPYVFISHDRAVGGREVKKPTSMTTRSVQRVIEKYAHNVGLELTANDLRRARMAKLYAQGLTENEIKEQMGYTKRTSIKHLHS